MPLDVEIKARTRDHDRIREVLKDQGALFRGIDHQIDTYFCVPNGRLKLREGNIERSLVWYDRKNDRGPKRSDVRLVPLGEDASMLKAVLLSALGVMVVVDKKREISFIDNVKFHIDTVVGLGTFMEIEAIDTDGTRDEKILREQCLHFMALLGVADEDLCSDSYSDLLLDATGAS